MTPPIRPDRPVYDPRTDWRFAPEAGLERVQQAAQGETPERAARVLALQRRTGFSSALIRDNLEMLETEAARPDFDARRFARESPAVAEWLSADPSRFALMGRDLRNMGLVERHARTVAERFRQGRVQTELLRIGERALAGTATAEDRVRQRVLEQQRPEDFGVGGSFLGGVPGALAEQVPILARIAGAGVVGAAGGAAVGAATGAAVTGVAGMPGAGARTGAKVGAQIGAKAAVAFDVAQMEAAGAFLEYERLTDANGNPLDAETARGMALIAGGVAGAAELVSLTQAAKLIPGARRMVGSGLIRQALSNPTTRDLVLAYAKQVGVSSLTEGTTEFLQKMITTAGGELATAMQDGRLTSDPVGVWRAIASAENLGAAAAEGRVGAQAALGLGLLGSPVSLGLDVRAARRAEAAHADIKALADDLHNTEAAARAPAEVADLLTAVAANGQQGFHYSAQDWVEFFQSMKAEDGTPVDARAVAAEVLGDPALFDVALESGGTFEVPLAAWGEKLTANPAVRAWAVDHARIGPAELSKAEAERQSAAMEAVLTDLLETAVAAKEEAKPVADVATLLEQRVTRLVREAGRPQKEARAGGRLWGAAFRAFAASSGASVDDLLAAFARVQIGPQSVTVEREQIQQAVETEEATPEDIAAYVAGRPPLVSAEEEAKAEALAEEEARSTGQPARDARGRLRSTLRVVSDNALVAEYIAMRDKQVVEEGEIAALEQTPEFWARHEMGAGMEEEMRGVELSGGKRLNDVIQAQALQRGRVVARAKGLAKLKAELDRRGIDPDQRALEDAEDTSFDFGFNDPAYRAEVDTAQVAADAAWGAFLDARQRNSSVESVEAARATYEQARAHLERMLAGDGLMQSAREAGRTTPASEAEADVEAMLVRHRALLAEADRVLNRQGRAPTTLEQASEDAPRGRIVFTMDRREARIELFAGADASTFLHESAHFFLSLMGDLAQADTASERIRADYAGLLAWLGAPDRASITVEQEEQFARGFEAYLMEGAAPSAATRSLFAQFASWLVKLYRNLIALKVELTPEVRAIMGRMLATEAEVAEAEALAGQAPLFADAAQVMPPAEAARYIEAVTDARLAAEAAVRAETLAVIAREEQAWFQRRREEVRPLVEAEVHADPAYRARVILATGALPDGTPLPDGDPLLNRLDRDTLAGIVGEDAMRALRKMNVYRVTGGIHPDLAAEALGYAHTAALVQALLGTQKMSAEIDARTEARLRAEYGDPMVDGTLPEKALEAVHSAQRDQVVKLELEHLFTTHRAALQGLWRRIGGKVPVTADLMAQARTKLAGTALRAIRPDRFQQAATKAAKEAVAAAAKGDFAAAVEAKLRERTALALTRTALEVREEVERAQKLFAKVFAPDARTAQLRDMNLVNAARAILANVGMGRAEQTADDYLKAVRAYDPELAVELEAIVDATVLPREDFRDLSLVEFGTVVAQVEALWGQARRTRQMVIDGKAMDRDAIVAELATNLATWPDRMGGAGQRAAVTPMQKLRRGLLGFEAATRRIESWARQMDGGEAGPWTRYVWQPMSEAAVRFRVAKRSVTLQYLALAERLDPARMARQQIAAPLLRYTFRDKAELLGALLHTGNASNLDKLLRGRGWDPMAWQATVDRWQQDGTLDRADYEFLQGVWDLFEAQKPDAQRVHKEMLGYYFDEITAQAVVTPFGTFAGGYVPALADPMLSEDAQIRQEAAEAEGVNAASMFPAVGRGFTKGRVQEYARPLVMDLRLISMHLDAVTRFIHLGMPTKDVGRLLMDRQFRAALSAVDPVMGAELVTWAQRTGKQVVSEPPKSEGGRGGDRFFRALRSRSGLGIMALNVTNTLQQFTGFSLSAVRVKPRYLRSALWQYVRDPKGLSAAISELSPFMATRQTASVMEVEERINTILTNPSTYENAKAWATEHGYALQSMTQGLVDAITWQGAFAQAVEGGASDADAVRAADAVVRETQGSFSPEDVSRIESGTAFLRLFTMFYSYFNMQANLLGTEFRAAARGLGLRKGAGRMFYVYVMGFMLPAVLSQLLVEAMAGDDGEDDEDYLTEFLRVFFGSQVRSGFALVPGGNIAATLTVNQFNDKWYDDRVSVSPVVSTLESAGQGLKSASYDWWVDGEMKRRDIRDVLTLLSLASGVPVQAAARPLTYLYDVREGDAEPSGPVDFTRGMVTGRP